MDLADDIAYSTYDLEDAFKAGFLSPIEMAATPISVKQEIASEVNEKLREEYPDEKQMAVSILMTFSRRRLRGRLSLKIARQRPS